MHSPSQILRRDFSWALSGNVVYSACQWMILMVLARLGSPAQVGEYALGLAVTAPILLFCNFQLRALVSSDITHTHSFAEYLGFRLSTLAIALMIVLCVVGAARYSVHLAVIILLVGIAQALEVLSDFFYGVMQIHGRMDRVSHSLMMKGPLALSALAIGMYFSRSVVWALLALVTVRLAVVLIYDSSRSYRKDLDAAVIETGIPRFTRGMMVALLGKSFPFGIISMLVSLNSNVIPYFIAGELNKGALGIFSALYSLQGAGSLVMAALGQSAFVSLARASSFNQLLQFKSLLRQVRYAAVALAFAGLIASVVIQPAGLALLFKPEYGAHTGVLIRLMIAAGIGYLASCQGYALTAMQRITPQIPVLLMTLIATLAACAVCIPRRGLYGAAEVCIVSTCVQLIGGAVVLRREMRTAFAGVAIIALEDEPDSAFANQVSQ